MLPQLLVLLLQYYDLIQELVILDYLLFHFLFELIEVILSLKQKLRGVPVSVETGRRLAALGLGLGALLLGLHLVRLQKPTDDLHSPFARSGPPLRMSIA